MSSGQIAKVTEVSQLVAIAKPFLALLFAVSSAELTAQTKASFFTTVAESGFFMALQSVIDWAEAHDSAISSVEKVRNDTAGVNEESFRLFEKSLKSDAGVGNQAVLEVSKALAELGRTSETVATSFEKSLNDLSAISESEVWEILKTLAEAASVGGVPVFEVLKSVSDTSAASMDLSNSVAKDISDQGSTQDALSTALTKAREDILGATESFLVEVLFSREFLDQVPVRDEPANHIQKVISETLRVVDELYIGQERSKDSAESVGFSEASEVAFTKQLNEVSGAVEARDISVSKAAQESFACAMLAATVLDKSRDEFALVSTINSIVFTKVAEDLTLLNDAGYVLLQSYSSDSYFEDNYTGSKYFFGE